MKVNSQTWSVTAVFLWMVVSQAGAGQPLWQIGQVDKDFNEFAIAGDFGAFTRVFSADVVFTIGQDNAQEAWPFIHPGTADAWAGNRVHPFTIHFDAKTVEAACYKLTIHLTGTQGSAPPELTVDLNGRSQSAHTQNGRAGDAALTDPAADQPQTVFFLFTPAALHSGDNVLTLTTSGSWMIYDAIVFEGYDETQSPSGIEVSAVGGWYRHPEGPSRKIHLDFKDGVLLAPAKVSVDYAGGSKITTVNEASEVVTSADILLPMDMTDEDVNATVKLHINGQELTANATIKPERQWEIHLVHQTHLDIGYTERQEDVLKRQVDHFYKALQTIDESANEPEWAKFKWHPEGMWAVDEFMRTASEEDKARFVDAARKRLIHIDGMYAQAMTAAYSEEELFELMDAAARFGRQYGITVDSAMQSDVPGYTWGLVSALAHHGVKYISAGPNGGHRIGHTFEWADQPFYWQSPSGKQQVLFWMAGKGYSWFHGQQIGSTIDEGKILSYLNELKAKEYPFDLVLVRYCIGGDNGPPNPALIQTVKDWNEKYLYPRLIISRNSDAMVELEKRYGDQLPVVKGDFTPYWEDGMASTAADTGISRHAAEKLVQAQNLWSMLNPDGFPYEDFDAAWTSLIMYDEHTWGAHNSISEPDSPFAVQQAEYKQQYALTGAKETMDLLQRVTAQDESPGSGVIEVFNTLNWDRSQVVILRTDQSSVGDRVENDKGHAVPSQRLASGELAFLASEVPSLGSRRFHVAQGEAASPRSVVMASANSLKNKLVTVTLDEKTGGVSQLLRHGVEANLVDQTRDFVVNDYRYILGRDATEGNMLIDTPVTISIEDAGPLVGTLRVESNAPGANRLVRHVRLFADSDTVDLLNVVDKLKERRPEGVFFDFPFNVPGGVMKIDTPWAVYQPEKDQLRGANKNFFVVQRYVDISNDDYGITWMPIDAPIVQWDPIITPPGSSSGPYTRTTIDPNQTLHSWVMSNHWETNYKADQEGLIPSRYILQPHDGGYDPVKVQQSARSIDQPLLAVEVSAKSALETAMPKVTGTGIVVTTAKPSRDGQALLVRLFNTSDADSKAKVHPADRKQQLWLSNPMGDRIEKTNGSIKMVPEEIVTLRIETQTD